MASSNLAAGLVATEPELVAIWLLDWLYIYREAGGGAPRPGELLDHSGDQERRPWAEQHLEPALSLLAAEGSVNVHRSLGGLLHSTFALTDEGASKVLERRGRRKDIAARRNAGRQAVLLWIYHEEAAGRSSAGYERISESPYGFFEGEALTPEEVDRAAAYLDEKGLIKGTDVAERHGPIHATTTPEGQDCVESYGGFIGEYLRSKAVGGQHVSFGGDNYGQVAAMGSGHNQQTQNQGVDTEALMRVLEGVRANIPQLQLDEGDARELETVIAEIEESGNAGTLTPARSRSLLQRCRAIAAGSSAVLAPVLVAGIDLRHSA